VPKHSIHHFQHSPSPIISRPHCSAGAITLASIAHDSPFFQWSNLKTQSSWKQAQNARTGGAGEWAISAVMLSYHTAPPPLQCSKVFFFHTAPPPPPILNHLVVAVLPWMFFQGCGLGSALNWVAGSWSGSSCTIQISLLIMKKSSHKNLKLFLFDIFSFFLIRFLLMRRSLTNYLVRWLFDIAVNSYYKLSSVLLIRDPVPFLTPGSGIGVFWMQDLGSWIPKPESVVTFFWVKL
jgi:hypothetical protein